MAFAASTESLSTEQIQQAIATLSSPDRVESPFGALDFFDGVPTPETVTTIYDALDLMRGIEVFLNGVPGASLVAMRRGLRSIGITSPQVAGPDRGTGGKYLFLPPGHDGEVPDGYFTFRSPTFTNWAILRALGGVPAIKGTKIFSSLRPTARTRTRSSASRSWRSTRSTPTTSRSSRRSTSSCRRSRSTRSIPNAPASSRRSGSSRADRSHRMTGCARSSRTPPGSAAACPERSPPRPRRGSLRLAEERLRRRQPRVPA